MASVAAISLAERPSANSCRISRCRDERLSFEGGVNGHCKLPEKDVDQPNVDRLLRMRRSSQHGFRASSPHRLGAAIRYGALRWIDR
jgi:hypothetical protein